MFNTVIFEYTEKGVGGHLMSVNLVDVSVNLGRGGGGVEGERL